jgi:hypothetical protein
MADISLHDLKGKLYDKARRLNDLAKVTVAIEDKEGITYTIQGVSVDKENQMLLIRFDLYEEDNG